MYSKEEFRTKLEGLFGANFTSDERLDMMYKNYVFNEVNRNQIYGVSGDKKLQLNSLYGVINNDK